MIPQLERARSHAGRLLGLRLVHTHLDAEPLSHEDLTDLAKLRLDMITAVGVRADGDPDLIYSAHLFAQDRNELVWQELPPVVSHRLDLAFDVFIAELEDEIAGRMSARRVEQAADRAILVMVGSGDDMDINRAEFEELAEAAGVQVLATVIQKRPKIDPKYVAGKGKLEEIFIEALAKDANLLIFDHELSPSQARSIAQLVDIRVIDRTQLILDIFAARAQTKEGKIQVELAQLKYNMPRLVGRNPSLSRLAGGIGTRGPGESKLEVDRRRAQERVTRLEREIKKIATKRKLTRAKRNRNQVPVISIIGYTNTGKSTLLNTLTKSEVLAADMPFATLDPSSKRLRFPRDLEVVITDTVGFIRELPPDLKTAFMATLEELEEAHLLLEVIDLSDPHMEYRMSAVDEILIGLELNNKPRLKVFNKVDRVDAEQARSIARRHDGVVISALDRSSLSGLLDRLERFFN